MFAECVFVSTGPVVSFVILKKRNVAEREKKRVWSHDNAEGSETVLETRKDRLE